MQLIGRTVTVPLDKAALEDGAAEFDFRLGGTAETVKVDVLDEAGNVIREFADLPTEAGKLHHLSWDGLNDDGQAVADGTYSLRLTAVDTAGKAVAGTTFGTSRVNRLSIEDGLSTLHLANGLTAYAAQVVSVEE
jgi:flagellar basal-body rod modification protein FlgD